MESMLTSAAVAGDGGAQDGKSALPVKTPAQDGAVGGQSNFNVRQPITRTFTVSGKTWLNNQNGFSATATAGTGSMYTFFPWEFPTLWIQEQSALSVYNEFALWRPKSVHVEFMDAQNYTQINQGTSTPFMMPTNNGLLNLMEDTDYYFSPSSCPFNCTLGEATSSPVFGPTAANQLVQSWMQNGYYGGANQAFLPNVNLTGQSVSATTMVSPIPCNMDAKVKSMKMGSGHSMDAHWNYDNRYWRTTAELLYPTPSYTAFASGLTTWLAPRADECFGLINVAHYGGTGSEQFIPFSSVASNFFGPSQIGATAVSYSQIPHTTPNPQPGLLLHLVPEVGVLTTTGTSNCQVTFKVSWTVELSAKTYLRPRLTSGILGTTTNLAVLTQQPATNVFIPVMNVPLDVLPEFDERQMSAENGCITFPHRSHPQLNKSSRVRGAKRARSISEDLAM